MSDERRDMMPNADALRAMLGPAHLAQIGASIRAAHDGFGRTLAEFARAAQIGPPPEVARTVVAALEGARLLAQMEAERRAARGWAVQFVADFRASLAAWRESEEGRAFLARVEESRRREETGGAEKLDTIARGANT